MSIRCKPKVGDELISPEKCEEMRVNIKGKRGDERKNEEKLSGKIKIVKKEVCCAL